MQKAPCPMLLRYCYGRRLVGILPAVKYLLIGAIGTNLGQKAVEVLLQLGVALTEASPNGSRRQTGTDGIDLGCQLFVERNREIFLAHHIDLATLQRRQHVGRRGEPLQVGIGCILGEGHVLHTADDDCDTPSFQCLECGRHPVTLCGLCHGIRALGRQC